MTIYKGSTKIGAVYKGSLNFRRIYHGSTLVFGNKEVFEQTFTASGSITFPLSLLSLYVIVVGSGGSGGNFGNFGNYYIGGGGGGAGGYCSKTYTAAEIQNLKGKQVSFTVGAVPAKFASGNASKFLNQLANGGSAGTDFINHKGGAGGTASGGDVNNTGSSGGDGNYNHVGDASPGWPVSGGTYGAGGGGFAAWQSGQGGVGCVYIRYEY